MLAEKLLEGYSGFYGISESYEIADPIAYLNEVAIEAVTALHEAAQQYYIGDIIAQSQVIMEGVTGEALMESAGSKAKALWEAFKKRVKSIIDKVIEKLRKFVNWIRSKFSKKSKENKTDQLIQDIKSFDPTNREVWKERDKQLAAHKGLDEWSEKTVKAMKEDIEKRKKDDGNKQKDTLHSSSGSSGDNSHQNKSSAETKQTTHAQKETSNSQKKESQIRLSLPDGQSKVLALPMKDTEHVPIPADTPGIKEIIVDIQRLCGSIDTLINEITDEIAGFKRDFKKLGGDELISEIKKNDSEYGDEKYNNKSFDAIYINYKGNKPSRFQNLSTSDTLKTIRMDFYQVLSKNGNKCTHVKLAELQDMMKEIGFMKDYMLQQVDRFEGKIKTFEKIQSDLSSLNPPDNDKYVNKYISVLSSQITNGLSGANFMLSVFNEYEHLLNKYEGLLTTCWNNYKHIVA